METSNGMNEIRKIRLEKLKMLQEKGINPFPAKTDLEYSLQAVTESFDELIKKEKLTLAGRIMAVRGQGALIFFNLYDGSATFQGLLKKDEMSVCT